MKVKIPKTRDPTKFKTVATNDTRQCNVKSLNKGPCQFPN